MRMQFVESLQKEQIVDCIEEVRAMASKLGRGHQARDVTLVAALGRHLALQRSGDRLASGLSSVVVCCYSVVGFSAGLAGDCGAVVLAAARASVVRCYNLAQVAR